MKSSGFGKFLIGLLFACLAVLDAARLAGAPPEPIRWEGWSDAAFDRARSEKRLVILDLVAYRSISVPYKSRTATWESSLALRVPVSLRKPPAKVLKVIVEGPLRPWSSPPGTHKGFQGWTACD